MGILGICDTRIQLQYFTWKTQTETQIYSGNEEAEMVRKQDPQLIRNPNSAVTT